MFFRLSDKLQSVFERLWHGFIVKIGDKKLWRSAYCVQLDTQATKDETLQRFRDLDCLAGSWLVDEAFDDAVKAFDVIEQSSIC
jgi:hypothetical protein